MTSGTKYKLKGLNHTTLLNDLSRQGVGLSRVRRSRDEISFVVNPSDSPKVVDYIEKKCYNVLAVEHLGIKKAFEGVKSHLIAAAAVLAAAVLLALGGNFCLSIQIETTLDQAEVLSVLDEYGINIGRSITGVDYDNLENYLVNNLDGIGYAIVDVVGSTLKVKLIDSVPPKEIVDYTRPRDVLAQKGGVVTRIVCRSGTPRVKVGDTVQAGQVLISGVKTFPNGTTERVRADGEVYATVTCSHSIEFSPVGVEYVRSGKAKTLTSMAVLGCKTDSFGSHGFERYESETAEYVFFPVGIKALVTTYYELVPKAVAYTFEQRYPILASQAEQMARSAADFDIKEVLTDRTGNIITVTVIGETLISD